MNKDYILRMNSKATGVSSPARSRGGSEAAGWEVRPGGMLVQQRNSDSNPNSNPVRNIKVKVKYGSSFHQVVISSQASFGELKKKLAGLTGLNTQDQKLIFKEKERDSKSFLDICGVKDGSKVVLIEDELSKERKFIESFKNAKMDMASKQITAIRIEVDNLAKQVASIELEINRGKKVVDTVLLHMIELLMTQLIKLDGIAADGDVKLQRRMQVKRVQKYIETLDMLKIKNSGVGNVQLHQQDRIFTPKSFENQQEQRKQGRVNSEPVVVTTKWETF
ncbi:hypothetical protein CASFOL_008181 [Castilleja foliolosa]|uniref:BAG family molecular chaperone regulator 1 n=1 Tax=Castilleja foliolosa TaxID=1961234 RepID=A0ABD3DY95_9LAMI